MARERSERGENFGRLGASAADLGWVGRRGVGGVGWVRWFPNREGEWGGVVSWKVVGKVEGVVVGGVVSVATVAEAMWTEVRW